MLSSAVSYPLVILSTAVVVVAFMLAVIVPMFEQVYARMGGELPALTRWIIALSKSFPAYAGMIIGSGVAAYIVLYTNRNRKEVQRWTSECLLHLPVAGAIIRKNYQSQFCKLLYLLTSSGVPLLTGVGMLADVIGFYPYRESFGVICRGLEQGEPFSSGIAKFPGLYDRKLAALVRVGEETNRLPEMLRRQGEVLTEELEHRIKRMGTLLEPALILLVGLFLVRHLGHLAPAFADTGLAPGQYLGLDPDNGLRPKHDLARESAGGNAPVDLRSGKAGVCLHLCQLDKAAGCWGLGGLLGHRLRLLGRCG